MKTTILVLLVLLLLTPVTASEEEASGEKSAEALAILEKVDRAIKDVDSVRYKAKSTPSGIATNFVAAAEGEQIMIGWNGQTPEMFYAHVTTTKQGSEEPVELTGGGNGDMYFIIDHTERKAYEDMDPAVMGSGARTFRGFGMIEFVHDRPFDDELNAEVVELLEEETVHGEECYKIRVVYAGGQGESTWLFSKKDYLPRRRIRHFSIPQQGDGALEIDITELEINVRPEPDLFRLQLPEGYEQIDDFAP